MWPGGQRTQTATFRQIGKRDLHNPPIELLDFGPHGDAFHFLFRGQALSNLLIT